MVGSMSYNGLSDQTRQKNGVKMAHYSVLSPGLPVQLTVGRQTWPATVRARLPDRIYFAFDDLVPELFQHPQTATVQWHSPPLTWQLTIEAQASPLDERLLTGLLVSAPRPVEHRQFRRFLWQWPIRIQWGWWPRHVLGTTRDLSTAGCRLQTSRPLPDRQNLTAILSGPTQVWTCQAALLRQTEEAANTWTAVILWMPGLQTPEWQQWIAQQG